MTQKAKKKKRIELYHIGEAITAKLLSKLTKKDLIDYVLSATVPENQLQSSSLIKYINDNIPEGNLESSIQIECKISGQLNQKFYKLDPIGRVDVCIFPSDTQKKCLPIEVKMGIEGQAKSWPAFVRHNFTKKDDRITFQDIENSNYLKGKVPSFLAKQTTEETSAVELSIVDRDSENDKAPENEARYLWDTWVLCVLDDVQKGFTKDKTNPGLKPFIISLQGLIEFTVSIKKVDKDKFIEGLIDEILLESKEGLKKTLTN